MGLRSFRARRARPRRQAEVFQLGVEYNAHVLESILMYVAPGLVWR